MSVHWPDMSRLIMNMKLLNDSLYKTKCSGNESVVPQQEENMSQCFSNEQPPRPPIALFQPTPALDESLKEDNFVEEEENDDAIMEWLCSGMLPANAETILAVNQAYQESINKCFAHLDTHLDGINTKQDFVNDSIMQIPKEYHFQQALKVPALMYVPPYFRDTAGMCPVLNEEFYKKSKETEEFDMLSEPPRRWSKREEDILLGAVKKHSFKKLLRPFINKKELLQDKLNEALLNESEDSPAVRKCRQNLKENDKKIRTLRKERDLGNLTLDDAEGMDWNQLSVVQLDGSRRPIECQLAWYNEYHPRVNRSKQWTLDELNNLRQLVESNEYNFDEIAEKIGTNRTGFHCAEKYQTELNDSLIRKNWTPEEDKILKDAIDLYQIGNHIPWELVVCHFDGRTRIQCQVRWGRTLKPDLKHGRWSKEEDKLLLKAVAKYGKKDWNKTAEIVVGRTDSQCRERWCTVLDSSIKKGKWSKTEIAKLTSAVAVYGTHQWAKIRHWVPGRTAAMCKIQNFCMTRVDGKRKRRMRKEKEIEG